jgi:hypothetical protein
VTRPAELTAFGDTHIWGAIPNPPPFTAPFEGIIDLHAWGDDTDYLLGQPGSGTWDAPDAAVVMKRHAGQWNLDFCDGHAEAVKLRSFFVDTDPNGRRHWDPRAP